MDGVCVVDVDVSGEMVCEVHGPMSRSCEHEGES